MRATEDHGVQKKTKAEFEKLIQDELTKCGYPNAVVQIRSIKPKLDVTAMKSRWTSPPASVAPVELDQILRKLQSRYECE